MVNSAKHVIKGNPTHVLLPGADHTTSPQLERHEHFGEGPTRRAEYQAKAELHDTDAALHCRRCRRLPGAADLGEKTVPRRARFAQQLCATVAVVANGRPPVST